jgi:hypothetical protein
LLLFLNNPQTPAREIFMATKITVVFYITLCFLYGTALVLLPWGAPLFGLAEWGDNYFLLYAAQKIGSQGLQQAVASGWVRGAVTGLGLLNIGMGIWEIAHFRRTVRTLETESGRASDLPRRARAPHTQPAPLEPRPVSSIAAQPHTSIATHETTFDDSSSAAPGHLPDNERSARL